jgi:hypothetical protein
MAATKKATKTSPKKTPAKTGESHSAKAMRDNNSFAIIETGGKQYRVSVGDSVKIEKLKDKEYKEGDTLVFDKVLLVDNGSDATDIGTPYIVGASR